MYSLKIMSAMRAQKPVSREVKRVSRILNFGPGGGGTVGADRGGGLCRGPLGILRDTFLTDFDTEFVPFPADSAPRRRM